MSEEPVKLKKGSKVAVVSLSWGILGEAKADVQRELGIKRLREIGLEPVFMPNALKGIAYLHDHPEARAADLKAAFADDSIDMILTAIGGDDTYRLVPYLLDDEEFKAMVRSSRKVFMGYSDTTINHFMLYKLGLHTFYGPSFMPHFSEYATEMLPYTKEAVLSSLFEGSKQNVIISSPIWYEERTNFSASQLGVDRVSHKETRAFELLQGKEGFSGELLGGCLESMCDLITGQRFADEKAVEEKFHIFPDDWNGKILFVETSEEKMSPDTYAKSLEILKRRGIFDSVNGIIVGKPQNEMYYEEYKRIIVQVVGDPSKPILFNLNFGHAYPLTVLPIGRRVTCHRDKIQF